MAKSGWGLIGLGLGLYCLFLLYLFPADLAWHWLAPHTKQQIQLSGVSGRVWSGRAERVDIANQSIGKLNWRLQPWSLLVGNVRVEAHITGELGNAEGDFSWISNNEFMASDLQLKLQAEALNMFSKPFLLSGELEAQIEALHYEKEKTLQLQGKLNWHNAQVEGVQSFPLGYIQAITKAVDSGSRIIIQNQDSPVEISGAVQLNGNSTYQLELGLLNRDSSRTNITDVLRLLGKPDPTGRVYIKRSGNLAAMKF